MTPRPITQAASQRPLVSIIIPCWNAEAFVGEAIESALAQTWPNVEVIVIDDGSTDESLDVIRSYGGPIRWETGENRGGGAARNRGIELARGELVQFLDADDLLYPEKLAKMVPMALGHGPGATPICDWERVMEGNKYSVERQHLNFADGDPIIFCLRSQLQTSSLLHWKEDLVAVGGFDPLLPCSQERDLHLRLACHGIRFAYLPEALYRVRRRANSVSSDYGRVLEQHGAIFQRAFRSLAQNGLMSDGYARAFAEAMARDARQCTRMGDAATARSYFHMARAIHPEGWQSAFGRRELRAFARLLGPLAAERLCQLALRLGFRTFGIPEFNS